MSASDFIELGPYTVGELPEPLTYTFLDPAGVAIDLTNGYVAKLVVRQHLAGDHGWDWTTADPAAAIFPAVVQVQSGALRGQVTRIWDGTEFTVAGKVYEAEFWVGNSPVNPHTLLASKRFFWRARAALAVPPGI